jgi:hypothetical protein
MSLHPLVKDVLPQATRISTTTHNPPAALLDMLPLFLFGGISFIYIE